MKSYIGKTCDEWKMWEEIRIIFAGRIECEAYKLALDKTEYLNYVLEEMRMCESNFAKEKFIKEIANGQ